MNPDPALYDGVLLPFTIETFAMGLSRTLAGESPTARVTRKAHLILAERP